MYVPTTDAIESFGLAVSILHPSIDGEFSVCALRRYETGDDLVMMILTFDLMTVKRPCKLRVLLPTYCK